MAEMTLTQAGLTPAGPTSAARPPGLARRVLLGPVSADGWLATMHVLLGMPLAVVVFTVLVVLLALTVGLAVLAVVAIPIFIALIFTIRGFTAVQRSRFRACLRVEIPAVRPRAEVKGFWRRLYTWGTDGATWRQLGYHLASLPLSVIGYVLVTSAWVLGLVLTPITLYAWTLPNDNAAGFSLRTPGLIILHQVIGLVALFSAPWIARAWAAIDVTLAAALLGPGGHAALQARVKTLTASRAAVVDAADAERRRIERDLHDGAQQRLVSLAMRLGVAREQLSDVDEPTRTAIAEAHDEAKQALQELRDLVRGLHPAILEDRGLDAALSGLAARSPIPVTLTVDVGTRPSATIESVAYFVVAESLTNVAKHARARRAEVAVSRIGDLLRVRVTDDGAGGADLDRGTGLRGLAQRVGAVDGTLRVDSPTGGPTRIVAEMPCES